MAAILEKGVYTKSFQCYRLAKRDRRRLIDLFSLYILFSHFRPRDVTLGKTFFQMSSYAREYVRITYEKKQKEKFP